MKKIVERLLVFFIGLPLLLFLIVLVPHYNHLLLNLLVIVFTVLGALEFRSILIHKNLVISIPETIILGAISPSAWTLVVSLGIRGQIVPGAFILGATWLLVSRIFTSGGNFDSFISRTTSGFALMIYPGLFITWIIQMAVFNEADTVILIFFLIVYLNDSAAWLAGVLFGKNNRGLIAASPNKSIAGFIGGMAASILTGIIASIFIPATFTSKMVPAAAAGAILGVTVGAAAILGDLGESALKRSAGVKDSGALVLGRGGALDSMDSLILAAPVYYLVYLILFNA